MEYISPEQAKSLPGLRLALTAHVPAPYSMSARAIFDFKNVSYTAVEQVGAGANEALVTWTGHRNAPVAIYNQESPRVGWLDILNLAERLGNGPSLLPDDIALRMSMIGLINEILGENGLIWNLRILMMGAAGAEVAAQQARTNPMFDDYGYSEPAKELATARSVEVLRVLSEHGRKQKGMFFIGEELSALDIYWAYSSLLVKTLPHADCPMPEVLRQSYDYIGQIIECDPILIARRDWMFAEHLSLPMKF